MSDYFHKKFGTVIAIPYYKTDLTTGESNTDLTLSGGGTLHRMPVAGSVIGITIAANAALTAGTITASAHSNGTEFTDSGIPQPVCNATNQQSYASTRPGAVSFSAGDKLGISVTTTTTLNPTNSVDVDALLFVQLNPT